MPITPDIYFYRLPQTAQTLRVVTRKLPSGDFPHVSLEQPHFSRGFTEGGTAADALNALAEKLEKTAAEIRAVAAELPQ